jgi:hypothetical protein
MIQSMSLRMATLALASLIACGFGCSGGDNKADNGPTTAKEKQQREAEASGEVDGKNKKWGGWRYQGDRNECFYVVGRKCFKTENAACQAAHCKVPSKCETTGGGPATISCTKN